MIAVSDATSPPHPSAVGVHLLPADCCLHANWAMHGNPCRSHLHERLRSCWTSVSFATAPMCYLSETICPFQTSDQMKEVDACLLRRLGTLLSSGWTAYAHSGKLQNSGRGIVFPKSPLKAEHERSVLSEGHSLSASCSCPPCEFACGSAQEGCRAVIASSPWDNPQRKLSASTPMHQWQVQQVF